MRSWKISHKLSGAFGLVLIGLLSIGGFSIQRMNLLSDAATLIGSGVDRLYRISSSRASLYQSQIALEAAFSQPQGGKRDELLATAAAKFDTAQSQWKTYDATCNPGEERTSADRVDALWLPYVDGVKALKASAGKAVEPAAVEPVLQLGYRIAEAMQSNIDYQVGEAREAVTSAASTSWQSSILMGAALLGGMVIAALMGALLLRDITGPLRTLTAVMTRLARNDTEVDVPGLERRDELGAIAQAVQVFKEGIGSRLILESQAEEARQVAKTGRMALETAKGEEAKKTASAMTALATGLERLSNGDLLFRLDVPFAAAYDKLRSDFNAAMEKLQKTIEVVSRSTGAIRSGSDEISSSADDLSRRTEQQAASLEETAAALDEITATVRKTAEGANHARDVVGTAKKDAEMSDQVVRQAVGAMSEIEKSAGKISQIIGVIDEIAFQTNLLALNAGVEAARAGDAGRGFAVVASEVRALAQRSADAAKEIKALIFASSAQVEQGVELVGETGRALERIMAQVVEINGIVTTIAHSAQEQATGLDQVNTAVNEMDNVTQQNSAMVQESTTASHALARETEELARLISTFKIGQSGTPRPAQPTKAASRRAPVVAMKTTGRGGAAPRPEPAASEDWREF